MCLDINGDNAVGLAPTLTIGLVSTRHPSVVDGTANLDKIALSYPNASSNQAALTCRCLDQSGPKSLTVEYSRPCCPYLTALELEAQSTNLEYTLQVQL